MECNSTIFEEERETANIYDKCYWYKKMFGKHCKYMIATRDTFDLMVASSEVLHCIKITHLPTEF